MAAGRYSFVIEQGTTVNFEIQYKDANGNPIDLTDYSGRLQIRPNYADDTTTVYLTFAVVHIVTFPFFNNIAIQLVPIATS